MHQKIWQFRLLCKKTAHSVGRHKKHRNVPISVTYVVNYLSPFLGMFQKLLKCIPIAGYSGRNFPYEITKFLLRQNTIEYSYILHQSRNFVYFADLLVKFKNEFGLFCINFCRGERSCTNFEIMFKTCYFDFTRSRQLITS